MPNLYMQFLFHVSMKIPDPQYIRGSRDVGELEVRIHGAPARLTLREAQLSSPDFSFVLLALSDAYPTELLGYAGFVTTGTLLDVDSSLLELRMLKVDPAYFRNGIATALLDQSKTAAREREKTLVLKPLRPGEIMVKEARDREYPLSTDQLRAYYLRHGFREFRPDEIDNRCRKVDDAYMTSTLWFEGINPQTGQLTEPHRYSMSRDEAANVAHIPFEEKLRLMSELLTRKYGHAQALDSNRRTHRDGIMKHLLESREL